MPVQEKTYRVLEYDKVLRRLAEHTAFSGGRQLALSLRPAFEGEEVRQRQARTREARDFLDRRAGAGLAGAHDMRPEIEQARLGRVLLVQDLLDIAATIGGARRLRTALGRDDARWPALARLGARLDPCPAVFDAIGGALDDAGEVKDGASPRLARLRRDIRVAHDRLHRQLQSVLRGEARDYLQEALITQRAGRYVIPVKADFRGRVPGVVHDTSDSGATVFVEPMSVVELGNRHRELVVEEEKEVARILRELSAHVADEADALTETIEALSELDLAFAMAHYGHELGAVAPEIRDANAPMLRYDRARHPLLDPRTVVPVDLRVGEGFRLLVITGPNTGGKTVTLKTAGLLTLMAQSGMHVPAADGAELTVFDGVFADIGDEQSIEQSLSTFSGHMTNIIDVLEHAGPRSLVLFDELGAGTDPAEGAALAGAILEWLRERRITTAASTHYTELKAYAWSTEDVANASVEFDLESLAPTYELTIGLPGRSNALAIAGRLGLPGAIVDRAREGLAVSQVEMEDMLAAIRDARTAAVEDREAAGAAREKAERWSDRLAEAVSEIEAERAELLAEARRQAEAELEAARETIAALKRRAERAAASPELAEIERQAEEVGEILATEEDLPAPEPPGPAPEPDELEPGATVRVEGFEREGELLSARGAEAEVQIGILRMSVPLTDIQVVASPEARQAALQTGGAFRPAQPGKAAPMELDLRGLRVDEALDQVEREIDAAMLSGSPWLHVIHGHGTGALKRAIREMLRRHKSVTRQRPGKPEEGGDGVTIVYFD